jgi:hypothetical protein
MDAVYILIIRAFFYIQRVGRDFSILFRFDVRLSCVLFDQFIKYSRDLEVKLGVY